MVRETGTQGADQDQPNVEEVVEELKEVEGVGGLPEHVLRKIAKWHLESVTNDGDEGEDGDEDAKG